MRRRGPALANRLVQMRRAVALVPFVRAGGDVVAVVASYAVFYSVYRWAVVSGLVDRGHPNLLAYCLATLAFCVLIVATFMASGLYRSESSVLNLAEQRRVLNGALLAAAVLFTLLFILKIQTLSRFVMVGATSGSLLLLLIERRIAASVLGRLNQAGRLGRTALIYGSGRTGRLLMKKVVQSPHLGLRVMGFVDDAAPVGTVVSCRVSQAERRLAAARVLGSFTDLPDLLARYEPDELLIALPASSAVRTGEALRLAEQLGVRAGVAPELGGVRIDRLRVEEVGALPLLRPLGTPQDRWFTVASKRALDVIGAAALLLVTAPFSLLAALAILADGGRPIIFTQSRAGRHGKPFRIYKFRTMHRRAPSAASSPRSAADARITRVGRFLRKTSIDEIPQLMNVLRGDMSLVGPRPEMLFLVDRYTPLERQRLALKPGLTGIWQLSGDRDAEIHENLEYDFHYIEHQSLALDLLILLETLLATIAVLLRGLTGRARGEVHAHARMEDFSSVEARRVRGREQGRLRSLPLRAARAKQDSEA